MSDILVEFSGWIRVTPEKVSFVKIGIQDERPDIINGEQWLALDEYDRDCYVLEDLVGLHRHAHDSDFEQIDISISGGYALPVRQRPLENEDE